jgi:hypothetical protein
MIFITNMRRVFVANKYSNHHKFEKFVHSHPENLLNVNIVILLGQDLKSGVANPKWSLGRNLENMSKILTFWATIHRKTEEIHPKYRKIAHSGF